MELLGFLLVTLVNGFLKFIRSIVKWYNNMHIVSKMIFISLISVITVKSYQVNQELEEL